MQALFPALTALTVVSLTGSAVQGSDGELLADTLVIDLTTTVPKREVSFRITGLGPGALLSAASLTTKDGTLIVTTPARLRLLKDMSGENLIIEVSPSEPWIHAAFTRPSGEGQLDLWGDRLGINRASGHPMMWAPVLSTRKQPGP